MRVARCYSCGSDRSGFYAEENGFTLVKCSQCGLLFVQDRPDDDEIVRAHQQGVHRGRENLNVTGVFGNRKIQKYLHVFDDLFDAFPGNIKTWLDVGCGHGEFMVAIQQYASGKVLARGVEPNIYKQKEARRRNLDVCDFDIKTHVKKYDVVSMLDVYSHLPDPLSFLKDLKGLLNPGGELILEIGDTAHLSAEDHFRPFQLPDHLSFATEAIVLGILERLDFEILRVRRYPFQPLNVRNIVKSILPGYSNRIKYFGKMYSQADVFIRARLK